MICSIWWISECSPIWRTTKRLLLNSRKAKERHWICSCGSELILSMDYFFLFWDWWEVWMQPLHAEKNNLWKESRILRNFGSSILLDRIFLSDLSYCGQKLYAHFTTVLSTFSNYHGRFCNKWLVKRLIPVYSMR